MIANHSQFQIMKEMVVKLIHNGKTAQPHACEVLGLDYDAVSSLYNQMSVRHLKREAKRGIDSTILAHFDRNDPVIPFNILANQHKIGGYKLARLYLEYKFGKSVSTSYFLENPNLVQDECLRTDLLNCMANDPFCSHPFEQMKECVGKEYEEYLIARLQEKCLCFETEAELRSRGKPKTPDILFLIPMATPHCNNPSSGLVVVNWIDSKAMFADEETLEEHFEQLRGYTNRYGRGLVIYWHGYVENLTSSELFASADDMILLSKNFPEEWYYPATDSDSGSA